MRIPIVHPKLQGNVSSEYSSRCTIQNVIFSANNSNQKVPIGTIDIGGMTNLACLLSPFGKSSVSDNQVRTPNLESGVIRRTCKIDGYFPQIFSDGTMRAKVDGVVYQIRGVDTDTQTFSTRLRLEIIRP